MSGRVMFRAGHPVMKAGRCRGESEHDGLVPVDQNSILHMPTYRPRKHNFFKVTSFANQIVDRVAMGNANDILFNDGAVVEHFGHIVAGGTDQLHSALKRLVIGLRADERR